MLGQLLPYRPDRTSIVIVKGRASSAAGGNRFELTWSAPSLTLATSATCADSSAGAPSTPATPATHRLCPTLGGRRYARHLVLPRRPSRPTRAVHKPELDPIDVGIADTPSL